MSRRDTATLPLFDHLGILGREPKVPRPYQARAIQKGRDHYRAGRRCILYVAPTGAGKTTIIAAVSRTSSVPVLFVAHRQELINQCVEELADVGLTNVGVIRGDDNRVNPDASIQVGSIQTITRRGYPPAGIVFIDECHRSLSDSYLALVAHYKEFGALIMGFTATPVRIDGRPMGNVYDVLEIVATYEDLIKQGFIAAPLCYGGPARIDLATIKIIAGDYDEEQLGEIMRDTELVGSALKHWMDLANKYRKENGALIEGPYRRTFIFCTTIQHSLDVCERWTAAGFRIAHLDGSTPDGQRKKIIRAIQDGDLDAVSNVGILLEGVNVPPVKCVVHLRPTHSLVLWRQSAMRICRPWNGVEPLLLDHAGNIGRLGFPHEDLYWELNSKARRMEAKVATRICPSCYAYMPAYKQVCPYCGAETPPPPPSDLPRETEEKLQQLACESPEEMRKMYFRTIVGVAKKQGNKPGFASVRYKERYGQWPPRAWSDYVKWMFSTDVEWQANRAKKEEIKAKRELQKQAKELAKIENEMPDQGSGDDDDIAF